MKAEPRTPAFATLTGRPRRQVPPHERLAELRGDMRETKARVREVLEALAKKYEIPTKDVSYAIDGYADDMLSDLVFGIERDLEHAAEGEAPLPPASP
jgi:hypothetical protein